MVRKITLAELSECNGRDGKPAWVAIERKVFNITKYCKLHPGGRKILLDQAGKDVSELFWQFHRRDVLDTIGAKLVVGELDQPLKTPRSRRTRKRMPSKPNEVVGEYASIPYASSMWEHGFFSKYWTDEHRRFHKALIRAMTELKIKERVRLVKATGKFDISIIQDLAKAGIWPIFLPHGALESDLVAPLICGLHLNQVDYFHKWLLHQVCIQYEMGGYVGAFYLALPPVVSFMAEPHRTRISKECMAGEKIIALAISEPAAGSDVANLTTTAVRSSCGKFFIVNGFKKWITNGTYADYFTTAVRTGEPGLKGVSMLLIPRVQGVKTRKIKTSGDNSESGTAYVTFEDVKVPVDHLLGKENNGFKIIMHNFNFERWGILVQVMTVIRLSIYETMKWVNQRKVFGKKLIAQPVVRHKIGIMCAKAEACQGWLENLTHQLDKMSRNQQNAFLGGPLGLAKAYIATVAEECCSEASQIFGGRGMTRGGMGSVVEQLFRGAKGSTIPGGATDVMYDLGVRQAMKFFPDDAKL